MHLYGKRREIPICSSQFESCHCSHHPAVVCSNANSFFFACHIIDTEKSEKRNIENNDRKFISIEDNIMAMAEMIWEKKKIKKKTCEKSEVDRMDEKARIGTNYMVQTFLQCWTRHHTEATPATTTTNENEDEEKKDGFFYSLLTIWQLREKFSRQKSCP